MGKGCKEQTSKQQLKKARNDFMVYIFTNYNSWYSQVVYSFLHATRTNLFNVSKVFTSFSISKALPPPKETMSFIFKNSEIPEKFI